MTERRTGSRFDAPPDVDSDLDGDLRVLDDIFRNEVGVNPRCINNVCSVAHFDKKRSQHLILSGERRRKLEERSAAH